MRYLGQNQRSSSISRRIIVIYSITAFTFYRTATVNDIITENFGAPEQLEISMLNNTVDEHILRILNDAKITSIDEDKLVRLPTWEAITSMYGDKPVILGLETCEQYRNMVKPEDRITGPAGLTNTGTNLIWKLMRDHCNIDGKILWQAPWGKHERVVINQTDFFPLTMIKDPFSWMNSQCRHDYWITRWNTEYDERHCPRLIRMNIRDHNETVPVRLVTATANEVHDSLLDVYNWWYQGWETERKKLPHLSIRYEDLLFHGREVSRIACECVGGSLEGDFHFGSESAKGSSGAHKGASGLVDALIRYGDPLMRLSGFSFRDLSYARRNDATAELMKKYNYSYPMF